MRKFLYSLVLLAAVQTAVAQPIAETKARQRALAFLSSSHVPSSSLKRVNTSDKTLYIYNVGTDDGFVVMSGDERARSVLAYSTHGRFSTDNVQSMAWLTQYENELRGLDEFSGEQEEAAPEAVYPTDAVAPLLATTWDQGVPYNLLCPVDEAGDGSSRSLTGCVATVVAQLMYHHHYPAHATGTISYWDWMQSVQRTMDFDAQPALAWDQMLPSYRNVTVTAMQQEAVAQLMLQAGHASEMSYSAGASNAYYVTAAQGMMNHFGYDPGMSRYERQYLSTQQWVDILMDELRAGRPVFYTGTSPTSNTGHAFICDGYDGHGLFHFNWGWSGLSDGYYALSALQPGAQGAGSTGKNYNREQVIFCKIQPPVADSHPQNDGMVVSTEFALDQIEREYYQQLIALRTERVGIGFRLHNMGLADDRREVCVGTEHEGQVVPLTNVTSVGLQAGWNKKVTLWLQRLDEWADASTELAIYGRQEGESAWQRLATADGATRAFLLETTELEYHLTAVSPSLHVSVAEPYVPAIAYAGRDNPLTLTVVNDGETTVQRLVGLRLRSTDGTQTLYCSQYTYCPPGEQTALPLTLSTSGMEAGTYLLQPFYCTSTSATATPTDDNIVLFDSPAELTLSEHPLITIERNLAGYVLDLANQWVEIQVFQPSARIPFHGRIMAKVLRVTGTSTTDRTDTGVRLYSEHLDLTTPSLKTYRLYGTDVDLATGSDYEIVFYIDDGYEEAMYAERLTVTGSPTGINELSDDGEQGAHTWWTLDGRRVHPQDLKPGIYVEVSSGNGHPTVRKVMIKP